MYAPIAKVNRMLVKPRLDSGPAVPPDRDEIIFVFSLKRKKLGLE
jgi:hypothetical protein